MPWGELLPCATDPAAYLIPIPQRRAVGRDGSGFVLISSRIHVDEKVIGAAGGFTMSGFLFCFRLDNQLIDRRESGHATATSDWEKRHAQQLVRLTGPAANRLPLRVVRSIIILQSERERGMAKKDRCRRIKRSHATVVWDDSRNPKGNRQKVHAHDNSEVEVESVLLDDDALVVANHSFPEHCLVFGFTYTDRVLAVPFEILDEDEPIVRPITAFEPSED
jgi:hypothetical protein